MKNGVRVLGLAPGFVPTNMAANALGATEVEKLVVSRALNKRLIETEEIGRFVAFLATNKAGFVTEETLVMDGGLRPSL
ncbi:MAG TPA: hypothetical protein DCF62_04715 [Porticoccaceae bacterium]|nr:hypothetical protein [Porticoccaceae bacterium]